MANDVFLLLHGWGGNKPEHWQEHLYTGLTNAGAKVHYPKMPEPTAPDLNTWLPRLAGELDEITAQTPDAPLTVLAHSLGSITWMHLAAQRGANGNQIADRVLLVAPPYVLPQAPPPDAPPSVAAFFPPPLEPAASQSHCARNRNCRLGYRRLLYVRPDQRVRGQIGNADPSAQGSRAYQPVLRIWRMALGAGMVLETRRSAAAAALIFLLPNQSAQLTVCEWNALPAGLAALL